MTSCEIVRNNHWQAETALAMTDRSRRIYLMVRTSNLCEDCGSYNTMNSLARDMSQIQTYRIAIE